MAPATIRLLPRFPRVGQQKSCRGSLPSGLPSVGRDGNVRQTTSRCNPSIYCEALLLKERFGLRREQILYVNWRYGVDGPGQDCDWIDNRGMARFREGREDLDILIGRVVGLIYDAKRCLAARNQEQRRPHVLRRRNLVDD